MDAGQKAINIHSIASNTNQIADKVTPKIVVANIVYPVIITTVYCPLKSDTPVIDSIAASIYF